MNASATVAASFDPALVARIPYAFAQMHGVLAYGNDGESVVVLLRPDATVDGIAEVKRVLNRPLLTRAVAAEAFAAELARAYNQGGALAWSDDAANESDLTRLLQDLPPAEDLLDTGAQAFGTLNAGAVTDTAPAAMLRSGSVNASLLASTPANSFTASMESKRSSGCLRT